MTRKAHALDTYAAKRDFTATPEPGPKRPAKKGRQLTFVLHRHDATHLHFDLRLEYNGVLLSWAIPKAPPVARGERRLAVHTEDHPLSYRTFKGIIPQGNYGAGTMTIADSGTYTPSDVQTRADAEAEIKKGLRAGKLRLVFSGKVMTGEYALVRTKLGGSKESWLLIKTAGTSATVPAAGAKPTKIRENSATTTIAPMLADAGGAPFDDPHWLFERKWDGYRATARKDGDAIDLRSRTGQDFGKRYPPLAKALASLDQDVVVDGEIVALDADGHAHFQWLQDFTGKARGTLCYCLFDLLALNGEDLHAVPLLQRKELLRALLKRRGVDRKTLVYSEHILKSGAKAFKKAQKEGWEGLIAKRADSPYVEGKRSRDWVKIKTRMRQEAVIAGFTQGRGSRQGFGALLLGVYEGQTLRYAGHVGTGFSQAQISALRERLDKLRRATSAFASPPKPNAPVTWVRPELVAEVGFQEWTADGMMRQARFLGLRDDKPVQNVAHERSSLVKTSNLDKIYFPELALSKGDVLNYYERLAPIILPHLQGRPESLLRHPHGIHGEAFFQKNLPATTPDYVASVTVYSESAQRDIRYAVCDNLPTLQNLVNLGCIELNPWHSRIGSLSRPDYLVLDLDPHEAAFADTIKVAQAAHKLLDKIDMPHVCKTSGKRGLHIYIPLAATIEDDAIKDLALILAQTIHRRVPSLTSLERSPKARRGLVYIDYLRNARGQTLAAPYSLRPTPAATVSTPLLWSEVKAGLDPTAFTIATIERRLDKHGDLWQPILGESGDVVQALERLAKVK